MNAFGFDHSAEQEGLQGRFQKSQTQDERTKNQTLKKKLDFGIVAIQQVVFKLPKTHRLSGILSLPKGRVEAGLGAISPNSAALRPIFSLEDLRKKAQGADPEQLRAYYAITVW